ncbi:hypothetical protein [Streptomyces luridiscabiei]|uniref:hypothetical protein n=1 Tax=Streptomyces luridiscabiei TaxID=164114 RepID=UPI0006E44A47|nr:hypothetical protein [Streptomyces luridiscabiei]
MHDDSARDDGTGNDEFESADGIVSIDGVAVIDFRSERDQAQDIEAAHAEALELEEWYWDTLEEFRYGISARREELRDDPRDDFDVEIAKELMDAGFLEPIWFEQPERLGTYDTAKVSGGITHAEVMEALSRYNEVYNGQKRETSAGVRLDVGRFKDATRHLFYRAKLNYLFGKGGSGKTNLLLHVAAEFVMRRQFVVWLIFEEITPAELQEMMIHQGVPEGLVYRYFLPFQVTEKKAPEIRGYASLVVIDSANPCMEFLGVNPTMDSGAITKLVTTYFDPYRAQNSDMTGIVIDHVGNGKDAQHRPSGHHSKLDKFQGAVYRLAPMREGVEGDWGYSALYLAKDNKRKTGLRTGKVAGYVVMDSSDESGTLDVRVVSGEPTGTSHTPAREKAAAIEGNSTRAIAERLLAAAGADGLSRKEWGAAILAELKTAKPDVDDARHGADIRDNISKLRRAEVVGENSDGNLVHLPTVKPLD